MTDLNDIHRAIGNMETGLRATNHRLDEQHDDQKQMMSKLTDIHICVSSLPDRVASLERVKNKLLAGAVIISAAMGTASQKLTSFFTN